MRISKQYVCLFLLPICAFAQGNTAVGDSLPVKRVVLYKSGVGYFEHVGRVRESQDVTIPFTSGQLNDVLKSLTVLDLNGGASPASNMARPRRWIGNSAIFVCQ